MQPGVKASLGIATLITGQRAAGGAGAAAGADESHQRVWQGKLESCESAVSSTNRSNSAWAASMRSNGSLATTEGSK